MADGFKAHGSGLGPKLAASQAAGMTGLQRRVEAARARDRAAVVARRGAVVAEQGRDEQGTSGETAGVKPPAAVSPEYLRGYAAARGEDGPPVEQPKIKGALAKKRGRPRVEGLRQWEIEGVSRRTWERRRAKAGGGRG